MSSSLEIAFSGRNNPRQEASELKHSLHIAARLQFGKHVHHGNTKKNIGAYPTLVEESVGDCYADAEVS
jgi:hypothetical protein